MVICIEACRYQLDILQSKKVVRNDVKLTKDDLCNVMILIYGFHKYR